MYATSIGRVLALIWVKLDNLTFFILHKSYHICVIWAHILSQINNLMYRMLCARSNIWVGIVGRYQSTIDFEH